jgi:biopolymer transport protein ExbB
MGFINTIANFFHDGGFWMYPILLVGATGFSIGVERFIKLTQIEIANRKMWAQLHPVLYKGDFDKAREMTRNDASKSSISQLLMMGLERQGSVRRREDIEIVMEEEMMAIIPQLEKRTAYIALFANLSTLLGLLGTIIGLIQAFQAVANAAAAEKASLLSASISEAMNCTAFGLIVAIPMLVLSLFLTTKAGNIIDSLEIASLKTLNIISFAQMQPQQTDDHGKKA